MRHAKIVMIKVTVKHSLIGNADVTEYWVRYDNCNVKVWKDYVPSSVKEFIKKARCIRQVSELGADNYEYVV